jgi:PAS domain S-box-containing protein
MKESGMLDLLPGIVRRALGVVERERKLAEANESIRKREERRQKIIHTALDGFVRFNARWKIVEINGALCQLLHYTSEEILQMSLADIETAASPEQLAERLAQLDDHGFARCITRLKSNDGRQLDVELSMRADQNEYFGFVHDLSEQRRLEREVLLIGENERQRFGRELHDNLGQQLTAIELMSHTLARELKAKSPALAKSAQEIAEFTRQTVAQARQLAHGLAPVALEAEGLMSALNDLARITARTGVACEFQCSPPVYVRDLAAATHLYRIAQEAVNNALKHAKAKKVTLRLSESDRAVELAIEDDGGGLRRNQDPGMGLQVIQHRARLIGAHLEIQSSRGKGVRVVCTLPKQS